MNLTNQYCYFYDDDLFTDTDREGFRRRVITGDGLQLCFWRIAGGATGSFLHRHEDHEQLGIIVRGKLDFRINDDPDSESEWCWARARPISPPKACGTAIRYSSATTSTGSAGSSTCSPRPATTCLLAELCRIGVWP